MSDVPKFPSFKNCVNPVNKNTTAIILLSLLIGLPIITYITGYYVYPSINQCA